MRTFLTLLVTVPCALALLAGPAAAQAEAEDLAPEKEAPKESGSSSGGSKPAPPPRKKSSSSASSSSSSTSANNSGGTQFQQVTYTAAGASSTPQGKQFGIGLQLGYPTSLTLKYMLQADQGLVAGIGAFSGFVYNDGSFSLHCDYVYHPHMLTSGDAFALTWYIGGGGQFIVNPRARQNATFPVLPYYYYPTTIWIAARVPIGVNLAMTQSPFEIYLEAVPGILLFPGLSFGIGASIGGRFYF